ncbi:hypothetical protein ABZP36_006058 [Zizania latifolia]
MPRLRPLQLILPSPSLSLPRAGFMCFGCTQEVDLDKPPVLQEVDNFFKGHGVGDFTFSGGKLPFDEDAGTGELRYVQMQESCSTDKKDEEDEKIDTLSFEQSILKITSMKGGNL